MADELNNFERLKEYLGIVVEMEQEIFMQDYTIRAMINKRDALGHRQKIEQPCKPEADVSADDGLLLPLIGGGLVVALLVFAWSVYSLGWGYAMIDMDVAVPALLLSIAALVFLLRKLPDAIRAWQFSRLRQKNYTKAMVAYTKAMVDYKKQNDADQQRVKNELAQKAALEPSIQAMQRQNSESRTTLQKIYDRGIIFPKYRNLIMMCSIYEYFCSGRCTTLEGHEGAYNVLEMEIRLDRIITQLDKVIAQLGAIQQNQYVLYSAIQESNQRSEQLLASVNQLVGGVQELNSQSRIMGDRLSSLQQSSALTAYHAERVQKELSYMNRMDYLTGRNDNAGLYNRPPT